MTKLVPPLAPASDFILVEIEDDKELETTSGIVLPVTAVVQNKKTLIGKIVAVGPGRRDPTNVMSRIPMDCKVGDRVLCAMYIGFPVYTKSTIIEGRADGFVIIKCTDIMAFLEVES